MVGQTLKEAAQLVGFQMVMVCVGSGGPDRRGAVGQEVGKEAPYETWYQSRCDGDLSKKRRRIIPSFSRTVASKDSTPANAGMRRSYKSQASFRTRRRVRSLIKTSQIAAAT